MIKMLAAVCRKPGMTHGEYIAYIKQVHAQLALANKLTLKRYVQNHVTDSAYGSPDDASHTQVVSRDSVTELYWDSFESMVQTFADPYSQETIGPDARNFADMAVSLSLIALEHELPVLQPGHANAKVMHFLRKAPELDLPTFFDRWAAAHQQVVAQEPAVANALRRCTQSRLLDQGNSLLAYFGGSPVRYEGVTSLWFQTPADLGLFRTYERALRALNASAEQPFLAPSDSFFVHVDEVTVL